MKKIVVLFIILACIGHNAYSFWIWSPKTGKWKNPQYSPKANPAAQLKEGVALFNEGHFKRARKEFKKLIKAYPDAKDAADAQYYIARCYEALDHHYRSFLEYQKLITKYPNSMRIQEAIERQYNIGTFYTEWEPKRMLGVPITILEDHPAIMIFREIAQTSPYSEYASPSLYQLGTFLLEKARFDEAKESFQKLIDNYPESEWSTSAKYKLGLCASRSSLKTDYDQTVTSEARRHLEDYVRQYPQTPVSQEASVHLGELKEKEAQKNFDIAMFYEKQEKIQSALLYYGIVAERYPESSVAPIAQEKVRFLQGEVQ